MDAIRVVGRAGRGCGPTAPNSELLSLLRDKSDRGRFLRDYEKSGRRRERSPEDDAAAAADSDGWMSFVRTSTQLQKMTN
jgi:hypothetical protein